MPKPIIHLLILFTAIAILTAGCAPRATPVAYVPEEEPPPQAVPTQPEQQTLGSDPGGLDASPPQESLLPTQRPPEDTPLPTPEPTLLPRFSTSSSSQDLPANIMEEILYFGGMGGGGGVDCSEYPKGVATIPYPDITWKMFARFQSIATCGWKDGENILATVTTPTGRVFTDSGEGSFDGGYYFIPDLRFDDPLGTYQLRIEGQSGVIETTFEVVKPDRALTAMRDDRLILYGFNPNERVRVFAYDQSQGALGTFAGWQEFQVDFDGKLAIEIGDPDSDEMEYYAVGEISGDIDGLTTCARADPSRLQVGGQAQVILSEGLPISNDLLTFMLSDTLLPWGTIVEIVDGPVCVDMGSFAWLVQTIDGQTGFVLENGFGSYYLSPDVDLSMAAGSFSCASAMTARLRVGMHARVTVTNGIPLRVRSDPGYSQKVRQQIPEATEFDVIDGPVCAEQTVWWKIQTGDGLKGWVAEGQDGEYYVEPW